MFVFITRANIHAYAEHANRYTHSCASRYAYACANIHAYAEHANRYTHSCASRYAYACANIYAYAKHANTRSFAWRDVRAGLSVARRFIGKLGATGPT
jgi:hypothetical protein